MATLGDFKEVTGQFGLELELFGSRIGTGIRREFLRRVRTIGKAICEERNIKSAAGWRRLPKNTKLGPRSGELFEELKYWLKAG